MILLLAIFKIIPCIDWGIAFFGILIEIADHLRPKKGLNTGLQSLGILGVMLDLAPQVFEYCQNQGGNTNQAQHLINRRGFSLLSGPD